MEMCIFRLKCVTNAFDGCPYLSLSMDVSIYRFRWRCISFVFDGVVYIRIITSFAIPPSLLYTYVYIKNSYSVSTVGETIVIAITCTKRYQSNYYVTCDGSVVANGTKTTTAADDTIRSAAAAAARNKEQ